MKRKFIPVLLVLALVSQFTFAQVENISTTGSLISHDQCMTWVKQYENAGGKTPGHIYGSNILHELLSQSNTAGIIIFVGLDGDGAEHLIFKTLGESGEITNDNFTVDDGRKCPPFCNEENVAKVGSRIEEGLAQQMIAKFQSTYPERMYATSYGRSAVELVLNQKEAAGIYFANGLDETNKEHLILVGVKENGKIMWKGPIVNDGTQCPPTCPPVSYPSVSSAAVKN